jgi:hypothetical protein
MNRIVVAAALIASVLAFAKNEHLVDRTGLLGACSEVAAAAPEGGQWLECHPGELTGYPDLTKDSCQRAGMRGEARYWVCPTALVVGRSSDDTATR